MVETSPSTATLTWSAPVKANGVIQFYEVLYENESFSALVNVTSNRVTLTELKPFSHYNVSVRAYTQYGNGNQTSNTLYLLSGEDGELKDVTPVIKKIPEPTNNFRLQCQAVPRLDSPMRR